MSIFFGKISANANQEFNQKQIDHKRYYADKGSSWFGDIQPNDYCYIISGQDVYFWQAKEWGSDNDGDFLQFTDIFERKLPINGNQFRALNFLKFNSDLMVLTIRQVQSRAFFKLELIGEPSIDNLKSLKFYENPDSYRNIVVVDSNFKSFNTKDIYLIRSSSEVSLYKSDFFDDGTYKNFRDNTVYRNGGRKNKNSLLEKIVNAEINHVFKSIEMSLNGLYDAFFVEYDKDEEKENGKKNMTNNSQQKMPLNQILYGPPGTGKTYNTINRALEIIFEKEDSDIEFEITEIEKPYSVKYSEAFAKNDRTALKAIFDEYIRKGQIVFTTFHQSYGYEEFVEGIKAIPPKTDTNNTDQMIYSTVDGILKSLVKDALSKGTIESKNNKEVINDKTIIWKMSLGDSQSGEDIEYFEEAIRTESIIMGYGGDIDFSECSKKEDIATKTADKTTIDMIDRFKFQMKQDDIVIISDGNRKFKAIARVDGDYSFDGGSDFKQKRKIQWLQKFTSSRDVKDISDRYFTQVTLNRPQGINREKLKNILSDYTKIDNTLKSYVLIIDEINRGNISKIFGELITLIEESKRIGKPEEIRVSLPYSGMEFDGGKGFGVPQNVYIIGTMNTADRSIALMDTALRRRFHFEEMMPDYKVLKELKVGDIEIAKMLQKINERIEYLYDRDHQIGHAYFMSLKGKDGDDATAELDNIFRNKIIPLLQEYFYDDWEKIQMVLGDHPGQKAEDGDKFIKSTPSEEKVIFGFDHHDIEDEKVKYEINKIFSLKAYEKIYS